MARMIPARILDYEQAGKIPPGGERTVFEALRSEPGTDEWIVLHSVNIPRHVRKHEGEADFVVLAPGLGVLVLEIKSHSSVSRDEMGYWHMGRSEPELRGPFVQASDAMYSLKKALFRAAPELKDVPFMSAVCFPNCTFDVQSTEWERWQVIDHNDMAHKQLGALFERTFARSRERYSASPDCAWFRESDSRPTLDQCERILRLIRPKFEQVQSAKDARRARQAELLRMTEEQYLALDAWEENERVLISGPAGTGKTFLAVEAARRCAVADQRVLVLCFNRLLGKWLEVALSDYSPGVIAGTLSKFMLNAASVGAGDDSGSSFWDEELPHLALGKIVDGFGEQFRFDAIIIDEVQDLASGPVLDVIEALVALPETRPKLLLFGDFDRQAIYDATGDPRAAVEGRFPGLAKLPRHINCRNTPGIGGLVEVISSLDANYRGYRRRDDGVTPEIRFYSTEEEQQRLLVESLERVKREGFQVGDITVLSASKPGVAESLPDPWASRFRTASMASTSQSRISTIHAFKGMESPVVAVTDIEDVGSATPESLLYVAMTRATDRLILLVNDSSKSEVIDRMFGRDDADD